MMAALLINPCTTCKLCNQRFEPGVPIIGEDPAIKFQRIAQSLANHIGQFHNNVAIKAAQASALIPTVIVLESFNLIEPELIQQRDASRKFVEEALQSK